MLTPEQIHDQLQDRKSKVVAEVTGLHDNTIRRFQNEVPKAPDYETVKKLSDYLEGNLES